MSLSKNQRTFLFQALSLLCGLIAVFGLAAFDLYHSAIGNAGRTAQNLASLLENQIRTSVQQEDLALQALQTLLNGPNPPPQGDALDAELKRLLRFAPQSNRVVVIGRDGYLTNYAGAELSPEAKSVSVTDRDYFQASRDDPSGGLVISQPFLARYTQRWIITLSRRLNDRDGNFAGVVLLGLDVSDMTRSFASLDVGRHGVVSLINDQRQIVARYPGGDTLSGRTDHTDAIEEAFRGEGGIPRIAVSAIDGRKRIAVFRRIPDLPFVVQAALSYDDVMKTWEIELSLLIASAALVTGALVAVILLWQRGYGRAVRLAEAMSAAARASEEREQAILDNAPVGIAIFSPQRICIEANTVFGHIFGYEEGKLNNSDSRHLYASDEDYLALGRKALPIVYSGGTFIDDVQMVHRDGRALWIHLIARLIDVRQPQLGVIWSADDITEKRRTDQRLRIAATVFDSQEGMIVTDADGVTLQVNGAFTMITGYSAEDAIGKKPNLLSSGQHDADFYRTMWATLLEAGFWEGEVWNRRKSGAVYLEWLTITAVRNNDGAVTNYVGTLTDITQRKSADDTIRHLAFYDSLTGLPNRQLLMERLRQAQAKCTRRDRRGALMFIDLDNFKTLNDTEGHIVGDELLKQVAGRLSGCVRECDTVARFGGDEFVIIIEDLKVDAESAAQKVERIGEKILAALATPFELGKKIFRTSSSIGITLFKDKETSSVDLLKQADLAMYRSKGAGRGTLHFYDPAMQASATARASLESDLREGIDQGLFQLFYQPQVDGAGRIVGAEALMRWNHPGRGLVRPDDFIPVAEETGLILPLGYWALETACAQLSRWEHNPATADLTLAINVSARQFGHPDFVRKVSAIIEHGGIDARRLKLELTESLLVTRLEEVVEKMRALKAIGVCLSLDDFGTGYSSLSYLMGLPLDQMKIDKSFIAALPGNPKMAAVVRTILTLARNLSLDVIAEGVETEAQQDFLTRENCVSFQGYLFGRPLPLDLFEQAVRATPPVRHVRLKASE